MGELLDRDFQRDILRQLSDLYPRQADVQRSWGDQSNNRLLVNMSYLHEHGLIELKAQQYTDGQIRLHFAKITAAGLDFIADDGGLSSILGVVTVKLHEDTIKQLLLSKVATAEGEPSAKGQLIAKIKELPSDALGALTQKVLDAGLSNIPDLISWLGKAVNS